jgi:hypothetical protein
MKGLGRFRPSPSMLVALLALVMATTGSAVAASLITSKQIKNGTIKSKDLSAKAKRDLRGNEGPRGAQGPTGPQGPAGPSAVSRIQRVEATLTVGPGVVESVSVNCPAGTSLVSGGWVIIGGGSYPFYEDDFGTRNSWTVGVDNFNSPIEAEGTAIAYCSATGVAVASRKVNITKKANALERQQRAVHTG